MKGSPMLICKPNISGSTEFMSETDFELSSKIILHYGREITLTKVENSIKLFGEDLIVAHKLLKNKIRMSENLLLTEGLTDYYKENNLDNQFDWGSLK